MLVVVWYRFGGTFRQRRGAYVSIVLLIGLVGGLSMGALAAARRTESSFPTFLASTNPSNLSLATALWNPALGYTTGYNGPLVATIARLPHVRRAESYSGIYSEPIGANGQPTSAAENANFDVNGSVDGLYFSQDRVTVLQGRMADPKRANEIMMSVGAADSLGLHVGQTVTWGTYTNSQFESAPNAPPALHERLTLVGTVVLNNAVVQDEIDANGPTAVIFTPALTRRLDNCCANYSFTYLQLDHGEPRRAGGRSGDRARHPLQTPPRLLRHLHRRHQGPECHQAGGHRPRRVRPHRRARCDPHRGSGDRPAVGFLGSGGAHPACPRCQLRS